MWTPMIWSDVSVTLNVSGGNGIVSYGNNNGWYRYTVNGQSPNYTSNVYVFENSSDAFATYPGETANEIELHWARPSDGKVLTTTMQITVTSSSNSTTTSSSGIEGSGGGGTF